MINGLQRYTFLFLRQKYELLLRSLQSYLLRNIMSFPVKKQSYRPLLLHKYLCNNYQTNAALFVMI